MRSFEPMVAESDDRGRALGLRITKRMDDLGMTVFRLATIMVEQGILDKMFAYNGKSTSIGKIQERLNKYKNGWVAQPRGPMLPAIAKALGCPLAYLRGEQVEFSGRSIPHNLAEPRNQKLPAPGEETLAEVPNLSFGNMASDWLVAAIPIRGRAMPGKEGVLQFSDDDIVGYSDAGTRLTRAPGVYAVYVLGDSMKPVMRNGFLARIDPHMPPSAGDNVVVQVSTDDGVTVVGYVKELVSQDDRMVKVCQYNPHKSITFPRKHVLAVHKVISWGPPY